jgi:hypothetical protein
MTRGAERKDDATHCISCGEPLRITGSTSLRFYTRGNLHIGWHALPPCEAAGWNATRQGEAPQTDREKVS